MNTTSAKYLFLIPARKGSKGIPKKNTKLLGGKPLICYTLEFVSKIFTENDKVCISTDDKNIIDLVRPYNFDLLKRPSRLATDESSMEEVINHALKNYYVKNISFKAIIILQPTSPLRIKDDFLKLELLFNSKIDMVVSVRKARENPYYHLYEENQYGFINKSKEFEIKRRQDSPNVYCLNGSFFMINPISLRFKKISDFKKIIKFEMPFERSIDIDDEIDWKLTKVFLDG